MKPSLGSRKRPLDEAIMPLGVAPLPEGCARLEAAQSSNEAAAAGYELEPLEPEVSSSDLDRPPLTELLLSPVSERLICGICMEPIHPNPRQCPQGHTYHQSCLHESLQHRQSCPECRVPLTEQTLIRNLHAEDALDALVVRCAFHASGCTATCTLATAAAHEAACGFRQCSCPSSQCDWTGSVDDFGAHAAVCRRRAARCVCGVVGPLEEHAAHWQSSCVLRRVTCPLCHLGGLVAGEMQHHMRTSCAPGQVLIAPLAFALERQSARLESLERHVRASEADAASARLRSLVQARLPCAATHRIHIFTSTPAAALDPPLVDLVQVSRSKLWIDVPKTALHGTDRKWLLNEVTLALKGGGVVPPEGDSWAVFNSCLRINNTIRLEEMEDDVSIEEQALYNRGRLARVSVVWLCLHSERLAAGLGHVDNCITLFLKLFPQPGAESLSYLGHLHVHKHAMVGSVLPTVRARAHFDASQPLLIFEEVDCEEIIQMRSPSLTFEAANIRSGDILAFERPSADGAPAAIPALFQRWCDDHRSLINRRMQYVANARGVLPGEQLEDLVIDDAMRASPK